MNKTARIIFALTFLAFLSSFVILKTIFAQNDLSQPNQNWQCLDAKRSGVHSVELSTRTTNQFPPPGTNVYIVECVTTKQGAKCTTSECSADQAIVGNCNDLQFLQTNYKYKRVKFSGTQPTSSNFEGKIGPFTWESETHPSTGHNFFGVGITTPTTVNSGQWPSLHLGTFYFPNSSETCAESGMRWDPYGRVFDSVSLEPLPNVSVTLLSNTQPTLGPFILAGLTNPQVTESDGVFNFVVPDGTYTLRPAISTHTFPNIESRLHPNFSKVYFDIYRGEDIVQRGFIQHRDIPMDPIGIPFTAPVQILDFGTILDKLNSRLLLNGATSHPLSKIKIITAEKILKQMTADKFGKFNVVLDNASLDQSQKIIIEAEKVNLTASVNSFIRGALAQNKARINVNPIPNNLEGYAFGSDGKPVPKATVSIFLTFSQKPFYTTSADSIGYFNIPSQYLPPLPFFIRIKSPDGALTNLTTNTFVSLNSKFAKASSVNYGTYRPVPQTPGTTKYVGAAYKNVAKTSDGKTILTVVDPEGKTVKFTVSADQTEITAKETLDESQQVSPSSDESEIVTTTPQVKVGMSQKSQQNITSVIIFFIIFIFLCALGVYIYKRKMSSPL